MVIRFTFCIVPKPSLINDAHCITHERDPRSTHSRRDNSRFVCNTFIFIETRSLRTADKRRAHSEFRSVNVCFIQTHKVVTGFSLDVSHFSNCKTFRRRWFQRRLAEQTRYERLRLEKKNNFKHFRSEKTNKISGHVRPHTRTRTIP